MSQDCGVINQVSTSQQYSEIDRVYFKEGEYYYYEQQDKEYINQGSFGKVYNCYRTKEQTKQQLCVKILQSSSNNQKQMKYNLQEIKIVDELKNGKLDNLMEIIDTCDDSNRFRFKFYLVMEKYDGDLQSLLNESKNQPLSETEQIDAMQQIMNGYKNLYEMRIIHRDLKPQNILFKKLPQNRMIYKITDFGFAKLLEDVDKQQELSNIGTLLYSSPQIINLSNYSYKTDIFSLGIIFYELIFQGRHPFKNGANKLRRHEEYKNNLQLLEQKKIQIEQIQGKYGEQLQYLLENMLTYSEQDRISIQSILQMEMFKIPANQLTQKPKIRQIFKNDLKNQVQNGENDFTKAVKLINQFLLYNLAKIHLVTLFCQEIFKENDFVNSDIRIKTFHLQMIIVCLNAVNKIYISQACAITQNQIENIPNQLLKGPYSFDKHLCQYQISQDQQSIKIGQQINDYTHLENDFQYQRIRALNFIEKNKTKQATPQNLIMEICDQFKNLVSQKVQQQQLQDYLSWLKFFFQKLWLKHYNALGQNSVFLKLTYQYLKVMNLESDYPLGEFQTINLDDLIFTNNTQEMSWYIQNKVYQYK